MTPGRTGKKRPDRLDGLTVATDDPANIALSHLQSENGHFSARYFGEHDLVGKFNELANDELEKLFHGKRKLTVAVKLSIAYSAFSAVGVSGTGATGSSPDATGSGTDATGSVTGATGSVTGPVGVPSCAAGAGVCGSDSDG